MVRTFKSTWAANIGQISREGTPLLLSLWTGRINYEKDAWDGLKMNKWISIGKRKGFWCGLIQCNHCNWKNCLTVIMKKWKWNKIKETIGKWSKIKKQSWGIYLILRQCFSTILLCLAMKFGGLPCNSDKSITHPFSGEWCTKSDSSI